MKFSIQTIFIIKCMHLYEGFNIESRNFKQKELLEAPVSHLTHARSRQECIQRYRLLILNCIFTPRVSDGCNSFAIVTLSFCLSVCLALTAKRTDIQTWFSACRSSLNFKVKVKSQGHQVKKRFSMRCIIVRQQKLIQMKPTGKRLTQMKPGLLQVNNNIFDTIYEW